MNSKSTADKGLAKVVLELERLGGADIKCPNIGNKNIVIFTSPNHKIYTLHTRSKSAGTWQSSTEYAKPMVENPDETEFWVFVDIEKRPAKFYVVPQWWICNDIYRVHEEYLSRHGGKRKITEDSQHHAIGIERIQKWHARWNQVGLKYIPPSKGK